MKVEEMVFGYRISQAVYTAVSTGMIDELSRGPRTSHDLAESLKLNATALRRLLNVLRALEVVARSGELFELTGKGRQLSSGHPLSLVGPAGLVGTDANWQTWAGLRDAVTTGEPVFPRLYGDNPFDLADPDEVGRTWYGSSGMRGVMLARLLDLSGETQVVDVGGGPGAFVAGILRVWPHLKGVVFDLPQVTRQAPEVMAGLGIRSGYEIVPGDFRRELPSHGGTWIIAGVMHSWADDDCADLLRRCRDRLAGRGRLLLIDHAVDCEQSDSLQLILGDLQLMVYGQGRRRSVEEYEDLMRAAGFDVGRAGTLRSLETVLEGVPHAS